MRTCPTCKEPRSDDEFQRVIKAKSGTAVTLPTRECVRCISAAACAQNKAFKKRLR